MNNVQGELINNNREIERRVTDSKKKPELITKKIKSHFF